VNTSGFTLLFKFILCSRIPPPKKIPERLVPGHPARVATSNDSRGAETACEWLSGICFCNNVGADMLSQVRTSVLGIVRDL
jgi:hypothetical protein